MPRVTWDYIAGFFDGEGSLSMMNFSHRNTLAAAIVTISQSGEEGLQILSAIRDFLGTQGIKGYIQTQTRRANYRVMHHLKISARSGVTAFLQEVRGRVHVKRVVVQDVLRFFTLYPSLRGATIAERNRIRGKYGALNLNADDLRADLAAGMSKAALARKHNTTTYTIEKYVDPNYRQWYDEQRKKWRAKKAAIVDAAPAA